MSSHMLRYSVTLDEPAIFSTSPDGEWLVVSEGFIPGSAVLGASAALWLEGRGATSGNKEPHDDADFRRLFLDGSTYFLNAYPALPSGQRALPTPMSLEDDSELGAIADAAAPDGDAGAGPRKPVQGPYARILRGTLWLHEPRRSVSYHIERPRLAGRPTQSEGAFFTYERLETGQTFKGGIVGAEKDLEALRATLHGRRLRLGRSRSAGYGGNSTATLEPIELFRAEQTWDDPFDGHEGEGEVEDDRIVLTLTSPMLVRDPGTGGPGGFPFEELAEVLTAGDSRADQMEVVRAREQLTQDLVDSVVRRFIRITTAGGYVRRWNLPRAHWRGLAAGSVLVFERLQLTPEQAARLAAHSFGERTAEGFGRIVVDWHGREAELHSVSDAGRAPERPSGPEPEGFRQIVLATKLGASQRMARDEARSLADSAKSIPSRALCARVEQILRSRQRDQHGSEDAMAAIGSFARPAATQLRKCRLIRTQDTDLATLLRTVLTPDPATPKAGDREMDRLRTDDWAWLDAPGTDAGRDHPLARLFLIELMSSLRRRAATS